MPGLDEGIDGKSQVPQEGFQGVGLHMHPIVDKALFEILRGIVVFYKIRRIEETVPGMGCLHPALGLNHAIVGKAEDHPGVPFSVSRPSDDKILVMMGLYHGFHNGVQADPSFFQP